MDGPYGPESDAGQGLLAETVRFELTDGYPSAVFKTAGLNHSPTSPESGRDSTCRPDRSRSAQAGFSMPRFSMKAITSARPALVLRLVITKGLSPWTLVRMRRVSASITARSAPT